MTNGGNQYSRELLKIISKAVDRRIYGSVEIYFEDGRITQITQRIINKVDHQKPKIQKEIEDASSTPVNR